MDAGFPHLALITHSISAARRDQLPRARHSRNILVCTRRLFISQKWTRRRRRRRRERPETRSHRARFRGRGRSRSAPSAKKSRLTVIMRKKSADLARPENIRAQCPSTSVTRNCPSFCQFRATCHAARLFRPAPSFSSDGKLNDDQLEACAGSKIRMLGPRHGPRIASSVERCGRLFRS